MQLPVRLAPLLAQFDFARRRLCDHVSGPEVDSGTGTPISVVPMTDDEHLWEPVRGCWSVRRRADGPGPSATALAGAGEWARDTASPHPYPPPFTTIAWRLSHLSEMLARRADWTVGAHALTRDGSITPRRCRRRPGRLRRGRRLEAERAHRRR